MTDHGLSTVAFGLRNSKNKLALLTPMKVNTGFHLTNGEPSTPLLTILTTEMTGYLILLKVVQLISLKVTKQANIFHFKTTSNKTLFYSAFNMNPDSSQLGARTNLLHRITVSLLWTKI